MSLQSFGGSWTDDKLERVHKYLEAYMSILRNYPSLVPVYVDAFAGTGYRDRPDNKDSDQLPLIEFDSAETAFMAGSASIALGLELPFSRYIFVERSRKRTQELLKLKTAFEPRANRIEVAHEDANVFLRRWCATTNWRSHRAVAFLDPYGMQVEWPTIECLAETEAIDLWYLFPLSAVNRLLTRDGKPQESWAQKLTQIFGTPAWEEAFYPRKVTATLFGPVETQSKDTDFDGIASFVISRLASVFPRVAPNAKVLRNGTNSPLFLLCFAVASRRTKTQDAALRIASHILSM